eukprot:CAMPEP_0114359710 /NCGR_PEP_ID=MMETSP0101-20121206/23224_1 /TAXON_ID=38822 ORGANISM="Pteridomonas danica, Strain PT" /NCGR_SAMPLE_ID=MMETSP0101 /ASSEMBLY_ACC=CAM_ASM_000211 /LENGTH=443 /DNA_ID=CAMNT_0001503395 /DNA_START=28 /DNA_END=1356 /DNA_ORIENTATION=-
MSIAFDPFAADTSLPRPRSVIGYGSTSTESVFTNAGWPYQQSVEVSTTTNNNLSPIRIEVSDRNRNLHREMNQSFHHSLNPSSSIVSDQSDTSSNTSSNTEEEDQRPPREVDFFGTAQEIQTFHPYSDNYQDIDHRRTAHSRWPETPYPSADVFTTPSSPQQPTASEVWRNLRLDSLNEPNSLHSNSSNNNDQDLLSFVSVSEPSFSHPSPSVTQSSFTHPSSHPSSHPSDSFTLIHTDEVSEVIHDDREDHFPSINNFEEDSSIFNSPPPTDMSPFEPPSADPFNIYSNYTTITTTTAATTDPFNVQSSHQNNNSQYPSSALNHSQENQHSQLTHQCEAVQIVMLQQALSATQSQLMAERLNISILQEQMREQMSRGVTSSSSRQMETSSSSSSLSRRQPTPFLYPSADTDTHDDFEASFIHCHELNDDDDDKEEEGEEEEW